MHIDLPVYFKKGQEAPDINEAYEILCNLDGEVDYVQENNNSFYSVEECLDFLTQEGAKKVVDEYYAKCRDALDREESTRDVRFIAQSICGNENYVIFDGEPYRLQDLCDDILKGYVKTKPGDYNVVIYDYHI